MSKGFDFDDIHDGSNNDSTNSGDRVIIDMINLLEEHEVEIGCVEEFFLPKRYFLRQIQTRDFRFELRWAIVVTTVYFCRFSNGDHLPDRLSTE